MTFLTVYPAWGEERSSMVVLVRSELSLPVVVKTMVDSSWKAVAPFCGFVMGEKETAEWMSDDDVLVSSPIKRASGHRMHSVLEGR